MISKYQRLYFELLKEVKSVGHARDRHQDALKRLRADEARRALQPSRSLRPPLTDIDQLP